MLWNQQLAVLHEHFCTKLLSDYKWSSIPKVSCTSTQCARYFLDRHLKILGALGIPLVIPIKIDLL